MCGIICSAQQGCECHCIAGKRWSSREVVWREQHGGVGDKRSFLIRVAHSKLSRDRSQPGLSSGELFSNKERAAYGNAG